MATWLTATDPQLPKLWPDMPMDDDVTSLYLAAAKEACIAYAPTTPLALPEFAPVTVTYSDGSTLRFSREGDIVTVAATPVTPQLVSGYKPLPAVFTPRGNVLSYGFSSGDGYTAPGNWFLIVNEEPGFTGGLGVTIGTGSSGPYAAFTAQWLADPVEPVPTIPDGWRLAQALQAQNAWNANQAAPGDSFDGSSYGVTTHPLDWQVKQLLRPKRAVGVVL